MTDIVERLSDLYYSIDDPNKCCLDAIDEIERLQLELQATKFCVNVHIAERDIARLLADRLEDENAKLRERLKK